MRYVDDESKPLMTNLSPVRAELGTNSYRIRFGLGLIGVLFRGEVLIKAVPY